MAVNLGSSLLSGFVYGNTGMLVEAWFTGLYSALILKDRRAMSTTSPWMTLVYGTAGLLFGWIHSVWHAHWAVMALAYTFLIYGQELGWSWFLELFGVRLWDYGRARYTIAGRVQPKYFFFWYGLACCYNPLHDFMTRVFNLVTRYG